MPATDDRVLVGSEGQVLVGRYRLERVLGVGGMGEVWLARHLELGSPVALKLMATGLIRDATARARFRREARAAANLRSPHLVTVHDFGEDDGTPFLVMEWLEGETLGQAAASARISAVDAVEFVEQACAGLGFAHAQGIIHRDIKPSNLFLAEVAGERVLKVLDFGIARALLDEEDGNVTRSGVIVGSPAFMSPAQANGEPATVANDLWSLAAVAYWMLVGREPFSGRMVSTTLHRIRTGQFTPPSHLEPRLSRNVDAFFATAFDLDPERRFRSAAELALTFRSALHDVEGGSKKETTPGRRLLWMGLAAAAALVLLLLSTRGPSPTAAPLATSAASHGTVTGAPRKKEAELDRARAVVEASSPPRRNSVTAVRGPNAGRVNRAPATPPPELSSTLTQAPPAVTGPTHDGVDPLFGIAVKSRRGGNAGGAGNVGLDDGSVRQPSAARRSP